MSRNRKSAVERTFEAKLKIRVQLGDWEGVEQLFAQYGSYLELIEQDPRAVPTVDMIRALHIV